MNAVYRLLRKGAKVFLNEVDGAWVLAAEGQRGTSYAALDAGGGDPTPESIDAAAADILETAKARRA